LALLYSTSIYISPLFFKNANTTNAFWCVYISAIPILFILHLKRHKNIFSIVWLVVIFLIGLNLNQVQVQDSEKHDWTIRKGNHLILRICSKSYTKKGSKLICRVLYKGKTRQELRRSKANIIIYADSSFYKNIRRSSEYYCHKQIHDIKSNSNPLAFDYMEFLQKKMIYGQIYLNHADKLILLKESTGLIAMISKWRYQFSTFLTESFKNETHSGILSAMTLGIKDHISQEDYNIFRNSGAVHILAVSGLHIGIIASLLIAVSRFYVTHYAISRLSLALIVIVGVWTFVLLSGAAPSSVRAGIMFSFYYSGLKNAKPVNPLNIIGICAFTMLVLNPLDLYNLGFQFSFLAMLGILLFYKTISSALYFSNRIIKLIWQLSCISVSAQIFVAPLVIYHFNQFPLYFILSGIITTPFAGLLICTGMINIGVHLFQFPWNIKQQIIILSESVLDLFTFILKGINELPSAVLSSLYLSEPSLIIILGALAMLALFVQNKKYLFLAGTLIAFILQISMHLKTKYQKNAETKLVVYDLYKNSISDVFINGHLISIDGLDSDQNQEDNCRKFRLSNFPRESDRIFINESSHGFCLENFFIILYPDEETAQSRFNQSIDLIIVNKNSTEHLKEIISKNHISMVIIDSTVKKKEEIITLLNTKEISFYLTGSQGAYILELT
ncbi:MAG: DUF4131 domain-containing protein, partial [Saprospiraceae bacterium]|nr:DUF4131 domain-containing protein [Saprospiraceae bacterium]